MSQENVRTLSMKSSGFKNNCVLVNIFEERIFIVLMIFSLYVLIKLPS